ncbi:MAG: twin-arginine translocation signal domain-containing protein, partial [Nitrospira sp.]|nr:twin-arginine translocation signal domain-containing protein [Nitrospira sp.]
MMEQGSQTTESPVLSRRDLLKATLIGGGLALSGFSFL